MELKWEKCCCKFGICFVFPFMNQWISCFFYHPSPGELEQWFSSFSSIFLPGPGEPEWWFLVLYIIIFSFISNLIMKPWYVICWWSQSSWLPQMINILCSNLHQGWSGKLDIWQYYVPAFLLNWMFCVANSKHTFCSTFKLYSVVKIYGLDLINCPPLYILW